MKRFLLHVSLVVLAFAAGVTCASALEGHAPSWVRLVGVHMPALVMLGASAVCFAQAHRGQRGLRRSVMYNMLMLGLGGLFFVAGGGLLVITLTLQGQGMSF